MAPISTLPQLFLAQANFRLSMYCKRPTHRDSLASYSPEFKVDVPSTSGEMMPFRGSMDIANDGTIFRPIPTVNPVFSTHSTCSRANLIYRVLQNYRKMYDDRWAMELEVPGGEDAPTYSAAGKVFSLASLTRLSTIMRKQMHYISKFIQETFDDFAAFDTSEQDDAHLDHVQRPQQSRVSNYEQGRAAGYLPTKTVSDGVSESYYIASNAHTSNASRSNAKHHPLGSRVRRLAGVKSVVAK
ncbi:hypothetical protein ANCDUO_02522 [Ancylostoma duodenale]|uniref:Uncharacterized protein n=1 Tax=Ancylostoma duodenale TaxID=51022 RepID=A0A0C2HCA5_9BILA|nr:hypothetical protein ANCDUO_02522 [Ancylostoma duodenale]